MRLTQLLFCFSLFGLNSSPLAAAKSPKFISFEKRLAKPQGSLAWLNATTDSLVKDFPKDPDAEAALSAYLRVRNDILGPLVQICNNDSEAFRKFASELSLDSDPLLAPAFEKALSHKKNAGAVQANKALVERFSACLKTGLSFEHVDEGFYEFVSNYVFENSLRKKLGIKADPILSFLEREPHEVVVHMGLAMGWEDLRKMIIRWENFHKKMGDKATGNPGFFVQYEVMKDVYLAKTQLDNTPVFDDEGLVSKEWLDSLKKFAKENKTSALAAEVQSLLSKHAKSPTF